MPATKLALLLFISLFITGCETATENSVGANSPDLVVTEEVQPATSATQSDESNMGLDIVKKENPVADRIAFDGAIRLKDTSLCDDITSQLLKELCSSSIKDIATQEIAIANMDTSLCEKMSSPDQVATCKIQVKVAGKEQERQNLFTDQRKIYDEIIAGKDFSKCETLTESVIREQCLFVKVKSDALAKKDPEICKELIKDNYVEECISQYYSSTEYFKMVLDKALNAKDINVCAQLERPENQKSCKDAYTALTSPPPPITQQKATQGILVQ